MKLIVNISVTQSSTAYSFYSMVDLLTVIPIYATYNAKRPHYNDVNSVTLVLMYIFFGLNTTRILRALRIRKYLLVIEDAVERCLGDISLLITVMLLFSEYFREPILNFLHQ